jgi:hypothetical protein
LYGRHLSRNYQATQLVVSLLESNGRQARSFGRRRPVLTSGAANRISSLLTTRRLSPYLPFVRANLSFFSIVYPSDLVGTVIVGKLGTGS